MTASTNWTWGDSGRVRMKLPTLAIVCVPTCVGTEAGTVQSPGVTQTEKCSPLRTVWGASTVAVASWLKEKEFPATDPPHLMLKPTVNALSTGFVINDSARSSVEVGSGRGTGAIPPPPPPPGAEHASATSGKTTIAATAVMRQRTFFTIDPIMDSLPRPVFPCSLPSVPLLVTT